MRLFSNEVSKRVFTCKKHQTQDATPPRQGQIHRWRSPPRCWPLPLKHKQIGKLSDGSWYLARLPFISASRVTLSTRRSTTRIIFMYGFYLPTETHSIWLIILIVILRNVVFTPYWRQSNSRTLRKRSDRDFLSTALQNRFLDMIFYNYLKRFNDRWFRHFIHWNGNSVYCHSEINNMHTFIRSTTPKTVVFKLFFQHVISFPIFSNNVNKRKITSI